MTKISDWFNQKRIDHPAHAVLELYQFQTDAGPAETSEVVVASCLLSTTSLDEALDYEGNCDDTDGDSQGSADAHLLNDDESFHTEVKLLERSAWSSAPPPVPYSIENTLRDQTVEISATAADVWNTQCYTLYEIA